MAFRMVVATSVGCPFRGVGPGAVVPFPVVSVGLLCTTGGRGGSITLLSVRIGSGASAGGKSGFSIRETSPPGKTGAMYIGVSLYPKHRFPVSQLKIPVT